MIILAIIVIVVFLFFALILFIFDEIETFTEKKIVDINHIPKDIDVILVLGAGIKVGGIPSDILKDRLKTAILASYSIKNSKLVLSGDSKGNGYDEAVAMEKFVIENSDIDKNKIIVDKYGFSTYESIYRVKNTFKIKKILIVTNRYHLPRALYVANKLDIVAYGIPSDLSNYLNIDYYIMREGLAQIKDFINVNIIKLK